MTEQCWGDSALMRDVVCLLTLQPQEGSLSLSCWDNAESTRTHNTHLQTHTQQHTRKQVASCVVAKCQFDLSVGWPCPVTHALCKCPYMLTQTHAYITEGVHWLRMCLKSDDLIEMLSPPLFQRTQVEKVVPRQHCPRSAGPKGQGSELPVSMGTTSTMTTYKWVSVEQACRITNTVLHDSYILHKEMLIALAIFKDHFRTFMPYLIRV